LAGSVDGERQLTRIIGLNDKFLAASPAGRPTSLDPQPILGGQCRLPQSGRTPLRDRGVVSISRGAALTTRKAGLPC